MHGIITTKTRSQCWMPQSLSDWWLLLLGCFRMYDINCHLHRAGNTAGRGGYNLESAKVPQGQCPFAGITFDYMQISGLTCRNHNSLSCETPTTSSSSDQYIYLFKLVRETTCRYGHVIFVSWSDKSGVFGRQSGANNPPQNV